MHCATRLLNLIIASNETAGSELASKQYHEATNMTDRFAALAALTRNGTTLADDLLRDFHSQYKDDALVIDKWLSLQASTPQDGTIDKVKELMGHPSFSMANPNRVRCPHRLFCHEQCDPVQPERRARLCAGGGHHSQAGCHKSANRGSARQTTSAHGARWKRIVRPVQNGNCAESERRKICRKMSLIL